MYMTSGYRITGLTADLVQYMVGVLKGDRPRGTPSGIDFFSVEVCLKHLRVNTLLK